MAKAPVEVVGYCVKCKKKRTMEDVKVEVSASDMDMAKGTCPKCGTKMCKILGKHRS